MAILANKTRYQPSSGSLALKKAIANKNGVDPDRIFVSHGAKTILGAVMQCIINPGDIVMIPAPYYPPFIEAAKFLGAEIVLINTKENSFSLTAQMVNAKIAMLPAQPKVLILNSPNNPTGATYDKAELKKIVGLSKAHNFTIVFDECYQNFAPTPIPSFTTITDKAFVIGSCSKTYAMTGWRIGWVICPADWPPEELKKIEHYLETFIGSPCAISEQAAMVALTHSGIPDYSRQALFVSSFLDVFDIPFVRPENGFYVFPDFSSYIMPNKGIAGSIDLANFLLEKAHVAVTPGIAFGNYDTHLRLAFCLKEDDLALALASMKEALNLLG